jgi:polysaccharide deacetylase 2 family uncharacterized protein YibQ
MKLPALVARLAPTAPLNHVGLSAGAFAALGLSMLASIQLFGDPGAARPRRILALNAGAGQPAFHAPLSDVVVSPNDAKANVDPNLGFGMAPPEQDGGDVAPSSIAAATQPPSPPLAKAPFAKLTRPGPMGPLPVIGADGTTPSRAYRRPFTGDPTKPRIGIIVGGLGFNARVTDAAINDLPADVTLSFVPYADNLQGWIDKARARGHEVLIELPMEPFDPDANDTGPQTLMSTASAKDNIAKLENLLSRGGGYFGVSNYQGAKFAMSSAASAPIVKALKDRGLSFVSNGIGQRAALSTEAARAGLPFTAADRILDAQRDADAIADQLLNLETVATQTGSALGAGFAFPVTVDQIKTWAQSLQDRGIVLAPASAIVDARTQRR